MKIVKIHPDRDGNFSQASKIEVMATGILKADSVVYAETLAAAFEEYGYDKKGDYWYARSKDSSQKFRFEIWNDDRPE